MNRISAVLIVLAALCEGFAYWGLNTMSGRSAFDEMAGMIPMAAGALGVVLTIAAIVVWWMR